MSIFRFTKPLVILLLLIFSCYGCDGQLHPASTIHNKASSLPERSFEVFWQTFEDNYAFFTLRKIDWHSDYKKYRPMVDGATSDDSLFTLFTTMLTPFADDHISIITPNEKSFELEKPSAFLKEFPGKTGEDAFWKIVDTDLDQYSFKPLQAVGPVSDGKPLFYYTDSKDWGYIRVSRCFVTEQSEGHPKTDAQKAGKLLDEVLDPLKNKKGMIIDLRLNDGGNDAFSYALAGRFATTKTLGHYRQTRTGGYEEFGAPEQWYIEPLGKTHYTGPVIVLTNDQTSSAAEVLTMALQALPQTRIIGENTTGIFSDMYFFKLPNKWAVSLSNQRYFSYRNICYEGVGIPPDIRISNTKNDLVTLTDPVLRAAIATLQKTTKTQ